MLFSFWMLSKVYFSERLWRILKSREPRLEARDSSSSMMSLGTHIFFPRSICISEKKETRQKKQHLVSIQLKYQASNKAFFFYPDCDTTTDQTQLKANYIQTKREGKFPAASKATLYMDC